MCKLQESQLFVDYGTKVLRAVGKLVQTFSQVGGNSEALTQQIREVRSMLLVESVHKEVKGQAIKQFREALYATLKRSLGDTVTKEHLLAWRALTFDAVTETVIGLPASTVQPNKTDRGM